MLFDRHSAREQVASKIRTEREEFFNKGLENVSTGRDFRNHVIQLSAFVIVEAEAQKRCFLLSHTAMYEWQPESKPGFFKKLQI